MQSKSPMQQCGAKCRDGSRCKTPGMKNGRCRMHGGKAVSPLVTGRGAAYAQIFGKRFSALAGDPDLLKADAELKLFDIFLIERAEVLRDGFSQAWIEELRETAGEIAGAQKQVDPLKMKAGLDKLDRLIREGGDRQAAWGEALAAAKQRADIAAKADANVAKREQAVADRDIAAMMCLWLELTSSQIAACLDDLRQGRITDADVTRRVYSEFKRQVGSTRPGLRDGGGEGAGAERPAPGGVAVH